MSEIDGLKTPKRILKNITFQHDNAALSYTTNGAASLKDKAYLFKSLDSGKKELSEEAKASEGNAKLEVSKSNDIKQKEGDQMSDQDAKIVALEKKLAVMEHSNQLQGYGLPEDVVSTLAGAMSNLEDASPICKALDAMVEVGKVALDKAKEVKDAKTEEDKTPLQKALDKEAGHQDNAAPVAKSLVMQAVDILDEQKGDK